MLPYELKKDKDGLLYIDDVNLIHQKPIFIDHRDYNENRYYQNDFYRIFSTDDYLIKYSYTAFTRKERKQIRDMLINLIDKQNKVINTDFPIGYFQNNKKIAGIIIKYYKNGVSLDKIISTQDINELEKYYYQDDNSIHNLFILLHDILDKVYEMFENGIYYTDINPGNIIINDEEAKIIDFDYRFVHFDNKDKRIGAIMYGYALLLKIVMNKLDLLNNINVDFNSFEEAKKYTKKLENSVFKK